MIAACSSDLIHSHGPIGGVLCLGHDALSAGKARQATHSRVTKRVLDSPDLIPRCPEYPTNVGHGTDAHSPQRAQLSLLSFPPLVHTARAQKYCKVISPLAPPVQ